MKLSASENRELAFYRQLLHSMNASVYVLNFEPYAVERVAPNPFLFRVLGADQAWGSIEMTVDPRNTIMVSTPNIIKA